MLHPNLLHLTSVRAEGLNYEQQNKKDVSKQRQNALEKVLQLNEQVSSEQSKEKVYTHFSFDFADTTIMVLWQCVLVK